MAAWDRIISALLQFNIQFGWRDLVDIIIVAYVFYRLILIIRGTRAEQLIKGVVLLLVAMIASDIVGFNTLHWLLKSVMTVGLIAIPIVFQPELRRALEHLGRGKLFQRSYWNPQEFDHLLEELTKAILVLVKKRIGALIIIERESGLKEFIETGIPIEGQISAELLVNIFFPRSPLHDGAVIIRGNQVAAAGCYLPLTDDPYLNKELGTRHRAGIGITEQSDAVAIIVSEETGIVSIAYNGKLTRYLDEKKLRAKLTELLAPARNENTSSIWPWRNGS
ncbi:MAG TPA: diadenylate cyclase CdaA [Bacillota bacterium]|nr:diadenylate cyclase CdaA [Bacillota bacterium]HOP68345.1 diadenylate cyclase CdaA [Bacillota bacterium]HPT33486.1 diadenylate cyclase CdaA [Bacillota bacterium]HPZ63981.1 diadenylate cyclase CdaA [Bacillota bacterium]HQD05790.1 diadenylate cyclase CdaA [Bacillota bacterium]